MSNSIEDIGGAAFSFLSLKVKAIILGVVIGLFFLIIVPVLLITSIFSSNNSEEETGEAGTSSSIVAGEIISEGELAKYADAKLIIPFAQWDSKSGVITSKYGMRIHPVTGVRKKHTGIDLVCTANDKVLAAEEGTVTLRTYSSSSSYGNGVEIMHTLSDGTICYTFYAHLQDDSVSCQVGDTVQRGEVIGLMGNTGVSTGPHLHFEVRTKSGYGNDIDPTSYLFGNIS